MVTCFKVFLCKLLYLEINVIIEEWKRGKAKKSHQKDREEGPEGRRKHYIGRNREKKEISMVNFVRAH